MHSRTFVVPALAFSAALVGVLSTNAIAAQAASSDTTQMSQQSHINQPMHINQATQIHQNQAAHVNQPMHINQAAQVHQNQAAHINSPTMSRHHINISNAKSPAQSQTKPQ